MKKLISALAVITLAATIVYAALEPSAITITVGFTGTPSASDIRTAKWIIAQENIRRAQQDPPLPALPYGNSAELKASTLVVLSKIATNYMIDSAVKADEESAVKLSQDEIRDLHRAITDRLNGGMTFTNILNLIKP